MCYLYSIFFSDLYILNQETFPFEMGTYCCLRHPDCPSSLKQMCIFLLPLLVSVWAGHLDPSYCLVSSTSRLFVSLFTHLLFISCPQYSVPSDLLLSPPHSPLPAPDRGPPEPSSRVHSYSLEQHGATCPLEPECSIVTSQDQSRREACLTLPYIVVKSFYIIIT